MFSKKPAFIFWLKIIFFYIGSLIKCMPTSQEAKYLVFIRQPNIYSQAHPPGIGPYIITDFYPS